MRDTVKPPSPQTRSAKICKVDVIADPDSAGPDGVRFSIESNLKQPNGELRFDKTADKIKKVDYYQVEFELKDRTQLDLRFPDNPADAIWAGPGTSLGHPECPTEPCYNDEFCGTDVDASGKRLVVRNEDLRIERLAFTLRFLKGTCQLGEQPSYLAFDPIITNTNGGLEV